MIIRVKHNTIGRVSVSSDVFCAWCKCKLDRIHTTNGAPSHGICKDCRKDFMKEVTK